MKKKENILHLKRAYYEPNKLKVQSLDRVFAAESFGALLNGSYGYDLTDKAAIKTRNKRDSFSLGHAVRLQDIENECADAFADLL